MSSFMNRVKGLFNRTEQKEEDHQLQSEEYWEHENLGSHHLKKMGERIADLDPEHVEDQGDTQG